MKKVLSLLLCLSLVLVLFAGCDSGSTAKKSEKDYRIALIALDSVDQHWLFTNEGAQKAAKEIGCSVTFLSPATMDDALSIEQINNAVAAGYDAILFAAGSRDAPVAALREADEAGVKIIYVDSPANYPGEATFCTDNYEGGKEAGRQMLEVLTKAGITSGKLGMIGVKKSIPAAQDRIEGFIEIFRDTDFELLETQYGEGDVSKSQTIAENFITQGVVGIFGCNESSTVGVGNAIKASGNKNLIGFGFDISDAIRTMLDNGCLQGTITQNPKVMGYEGVKAAVAALNGESLGGKTVNTGVNVIKQ